MEIFSAQIILMIWHRKCVLTCGNYNISPSKFQSFLKLTTQPPCFLFIIARQPENLDCVPSVFCRCIPVFWALISPLTPFSFDDTLHATHCDLNTAALNPLLSAFFLPSFSNHSAAASSLQIQLEVRAFISHLPPFTTQIQGANWVFFFFFFSALNSPWSSALSYHTYQCFCSWIQQSEADWPINTLSEEEG